MKQLNNSNNKIKKKLIRKAVFTVIMCILIYIGFSDSIHLPLVAVHISRIISTVGLIYILVSFKMD